MGPWEITATSEQQPGYSTLIESNLQEATASGTGTITATGADQLVLIGQHPAGGLFFGGLCPGATTENLTGTLSTYDDLSLTLTEGAAIYTLAGTVNTSGKSMTGTYTFSSGSCPDSGTFAGIQVRQRAVGQNLADRIWPRLVTRKADKTWSFGRRYTAPAKRLTCRYD